MNLLTGTVGAVKGVAKIAALFVSTLVPTPDPLFIDLPEENVEQYVASVERDRKRAEYVARRDLIRSINPVYGCSFGVDQYMTDDLDTYNGVLNRIDQHKTNIKEISGSTKISSLDHESMRLVLHEEAEIVSLYARLQNMLTEELDLANHYQKDDISDLEKDAFYRSKYKICSYLSKRLGCNLIYARDNSVDFEEAADSIVNLLERQISSTRESYLDLGSVFYKNELQQARRAEARAYLADCGSKALIREELERKKIARAKQETQVIKQFWKDQEEELDRSMRQLGVSISNVSGMPSNWAYSKTAISTPVSCASTAVGDVSDISARLFDFIDDQGTTDGVESQQCDNLAQRLEMRRALRVKEDSRRLMLASAAGFLAFALLQRSK